LKASGLQILKSYGYGGILSTDGLTVSFSVESDHGTANSILLISRYSFPRRLSGRGLQDWASGYHANLRAQAYLDGTVYLSERMDLPAIRTPEILGVAVRNALTPFKLFETYYLKPLGGQQVIDRATIAPRRPSDKMVVDYLAPADFHYLSKLWGWNYKGPSGGQFPSTWFVPVSIDGRMWRITGLTNPEPGMTPITGFAISGQFQAMSPKAQAMARVWQSRFRSDQVQLSQDSANVTVQTKINLGEGMTLAEVRKRILDFVHRAEKLPEADTGVFG
jgi:hypothetical protein